MEKNYKLIKTYEDACLVLNKDIINIELGYRHVDIIHRFKYVSHSPSKQGFYTSKGRFVSRDEAGIIAFNAGQISEIKKLFSEDLY